MGPRRNAALSTACLLISALAFTAGCELGPTDLAAYTRTAAGPAKIRVVIEDPDYGEELRADAVVSLLDLRRRDADGPAMAMRTLGALPHADRNLVLGRVLDRMGPRLAADSPLGEEAQVAAKDALTKLAGLGSGPVLGRYGELLIEWYVRDAARRAHLGNETFSGLVNTLGSLAAQPLTTALHARMSAADLRQLASLLAGVAQGPQRTRAAKKLIDIEARWRSSARSTQLEAELRDETVVRPARRVVSEAKDAAAAKTAVADSADATDDAKGPGDLLTVQVEVQRQREIETALLPALGWFTDTDLVAQRLLTMAANSNAAIPNAQRELALRLLTDHTPRERVGDLLAMALDRERSASLRVLALARAAEHANEDHLPQLLVLITNRRQRELRQRAGELVLDIGGSAALPAFFRSMPKAWALDYSRDELNAYGQRVVTMEYTPRVVNLFAAKLHSPYWWARVLALQYFAARGSAEDLWRLRQHVHDFLLVRGAGFPPGHTIGQEAQAAVTMALGRLRGTSKPASPAGPKKSPG